MIIDVDRLHHVIEQYVIRDTLAITSPKDAGVTTAVEQLLLAEVQLVDVPGRHFIYITDNEVEAAQVQYQFIRLLHTEPGISVRLNQRGQIRLNVADVVIFFVGVAYFCQRFTFMGTQVDKIFVDITQPPPPGMEEKLLLMQERGTEIV